MPHNRPGGPVPTESRTGRENQRFGAEGERLVAGAIPMRFKPGVEGPEGVEVLLITSRRGKGYVFPKGGWENDEELRDAAMRETVEEAGVRGQLEEPIIGKFPFHSGKAERQSAAHQGRCVAYLFAMHVSEELASWPEGHQRSRHWVSLQEACCKCRYPWMREALVAWVRRRGWEAAAAACAACGEAAAAERQQQALAAPNQQAGQQQQQQQPEQAQQAQQQAPAQQPPQPPQQQAAVAPQQQAVCVMAAGQLPAEAAVPATVDRIAVHT
ncbi:nudix hydrolase 4 [Chlorella sorokiniana]|uniref:Nudix hydrolase 4 n=1 Tax=Chlorella sorokiniana TaxID=3076 RepID=A0A2P6TWS4_CHLSO|nr:nudix hydrolase 4 [Chlorella sorokiniana]|eukprot:PRW58515.1 nudix hydrolase 4 [Chlorella sorokiniana]